MTGERGQARLGWGQWWSWQEQQLPPRRRSPSLILTADVVLPATVGMTAIRDAVRLVVARHTALRTTFTIDEDGSPRQEVWPVEAEAYQLDQFDDVAEGRSWLRENLDPRSAWPWRVAVLGRGPEQTLVGIAAHHLAADRYGLDLFGRELEAAVHAVSRRQSLGTPEPARQPADIAAFEESAAGAAANEGSIRYWMSHEEELTEELSAIGSGSGRPSGAMHIARAVSADARLRISELAVAARVGEPAVAIAAVAGVLAEYLGRSSMLMFMTSANRHLPGVRHTVCSLAQAGLVRVDVPDPRRLERLIPAASKGALTALRYAYYDEDMLSVRRRAAGTGGHQRPVTPPSINVMQAGPSAAEQPPGSAADDGPDRPVTRLHQVARPCSGLNFHVTSTESVLSIELRAGTHLLPAAECEALVAATMQRILQPGVPASAASRPRRGARN